jgi:predicted RNase H-like HicB family nuclease
MKWRVVIEHDSETDAWSAYCPELPGCASAGVSKEEALINIREAIELYLEPSEDDKLPSKATVAYVTV